MATRETIIKINLDNKDALNALGKMQAETLQVNDSIKLLNSIIRENGKATDYQARQMGELISRKKLLSAEMRELSNETSTLTERGLRFRDKMADATLEAIKQSGILGQLAAKSDTLNLKIVNLTKSYKEGDISVTTYNSQLNVLQQELNQTTVQMTGMDKKLDELNKDFKEGRITAEQFKAGVQSVNTEVAKASGAFTKGITDLKQYALGFVGVVAAAQALGQGVSTFIRWNSELSDILADVRKTTNLTEEAVLRLSTELARIDTRSSREELLGLARDAGKLGITGEQDILRFVRAADQINVALGEDLGDDAIRTIGKLSEQFKVTERDGFDLERSMLGIGSVLNELGMASTASEGFIVDFTGRLAGAATQAGLTIEQVAGFGATLDQLGQRSESSSTAVSRFIIEAFNDTAAYADIAGVSVEEFTELLNTDMNKALLLTLKGLNGNGEGLSRMTALFGDLGQDGARAVQVLATLAGNTAILEEQQRIANVAMEDGISITEEYNIKNETLAASFDKLDNAWKNFWTGISQGSGAVGASLKFATDSLTDFIDSLSAASEETSDFTSRALALFTGTTLIQGYQDTGRWWDWLFGSDKQKDINETAKAINKVAEATNELPEFEVVGTRNTVGNRLASLKEELDKLKAARNELNLSDIAGRKELDAQIASTQASIDSLDGRTKATQRQAAAVRVLTDEMRAFQAAQKAIESGQGIGQMDVIGGIGSQTPIASPTDRLLPGTAITDNLRDNLAETATLTTDYTNLFMNMSTAIGQSLGDSFGEIEDANKRITLSILEMVRNAARMYIAMAMAREIGTKGFIGLGTGIALTVAIEAALAAAINNIKADGFAQGGVVRQSDGPRYTRNPGDSVLISAAPGEVVMTREQQRRANMAAGFDVFRAARVPGFAVGGVVQSRGTALVNMPTAPRPSPGDLSGIRNAFQQAPIFVRVSEINQVQGTVARISERASL
jgi:TP901 family phage tail tape measure protein